VQVNVAFWSPEVDADSAVTVLAAEHSSQGTGGDRRQQSGDNWLHVLHVVGCDVVPGKDLSVVDMSWFVYGHPMTVWLAVAWVGGQVGVIDFSKGPEGPSWLWEQQVTVEAISACPPHILSCIHAVLLHAALRQLPAVAAVAADDARAERTSPGACFT
jgi:hypothetical protein